MELHPLGIFPINQDRNSKLKYNLVPFALCFWCVCVCDDENFRHLIITMQDILELRHEQTMTDQDCLALYTLALYLHDLSGPKDRLGGLWTSWFLFPVWRVSFLCFFTLTCLFGDRCLELAKIDLL